MTLLSERILASIAKATAQNPVQFNDLLIRLKGITHDELTAELDALFDAHRINRCERTKAGRTWLEVWPTGLVAASTTWSRNPAKRTPPVLPERTQTNKEITMPKSDHPTKRERILAIIQERGCIAQLALADDIDSQASAIGVLIKADIKAGAIVRLKRDNRTYWATPEWAAENPDWNSGKPATSAAPKSEPNPDIKAATPPAAMTPDAVVFHPDQPAIVDFGDLTINAAGSLHITLQDNSVVALPPAETARLGRFLVGTQGVWSMATP